MICCPKCNFQWAVKGRSHAQNDAYWGLIVTPFAEHLGYTTDECHDLLKENCNSDIEHKFDRKGVIKEIRRIKSTAGLTTIQFMDYMARCRVFASDWGCYCQEPNEDAILPTE